jgi:hypothetical protein
MSLIGLWSCLFLKFQIRNKSSDSWKICEWREPRIVLSFSQYSTHLVISTDLVRKSGSSPSITCSRIIASRSDAPEPKQKFWNWKEFNLLCSSRFFFHWQRSKDLKITSSLGIYAQQFRKKVRANFMWSTIRNRIWWFEISDSDLNKRRSGSESLLVVNERK